MRRFFLASSLLFLAACDTLANPAPFTGGYAHLNQLYKSQPGPDATDLGYDYSPAKNHEIAAAWQKITRDMLLALEERGIPDEEIYIRPFEMRTAFNQSLEYALIDVMTERGLRLTGDNNAPLHLDIYARRAGEVQEFRTDHLNGDERDRSPVYRKSLPGQQDMDIGLTLYHGQDVVAAHRAIYDTPAYGYKRLFDGMAIIPPVTGSWPK